VEERLQKIMAQAGLGSRRGCEELIEAGRVSVNGRIAGLGDKADPQIDRIIVDGQPLSLPEEFVYIAIYKPRGVLSAVTSPDPRPTVRDLVELPGHFYPVGRLDVDSEGLILLTNDGELTNRLTHPRFGHDKEYRVLVARRPDEDQLKTWRRGVVLPDGYHTAPAEVYSEQPSGKGMWLRVILKEGRKRQIRETGSTLGLPVVKIIRVRIGSLYLGTLKPRQWRQLTDQEVKDLKQGIKPPRLPKRAPVMERGKRSDKSSKGGSKTGKPGLTKTPVQAGPSNSRSKKPGTSNKPFHSGTKAPRPAKSRSPKAQGGSGAKTSRSRSSSSSKPYRKHRDV
jgi:23S rRNA pseudouridine2605 synthase